MITTEDVEKMGLQPYELIDVTIKTKFKGGGDVMPGEQPLPDSKILRKYYIKIVDFLGKPAMKYEDDLETAKEGDGHGGVLLEDIIAITKVKDLPN